MRVIGTGRLVGTADYRISYRTLGCVVSGIAQVEGPRERYWGSIMLALNVQLIGIKGPQGRGRSQAL